MMATVDDLLEAARDSARHTPGGAAEAVSTALLVDRVRSNNGSAGAIPGALLIERNVLEWRLDPASSASPRNHPTSS
jgi:hypothetical protein